MNGPEGESAERSPTSRYSAQPWDAGMYRRAQTFSLVTLAFCAVVVLLYYGQAVFIPVAAGVLLALLFKPLVRWLQRRHIPPALSSTVIVFGLTLVLCGTMYLIIAPLGDWVEQAPQAIEKMEEQFRGLKEARQQISAASEQLEQAGADESNGDEYVPKVQVEPPNTFAATVLNQTTTVLAGLLSMLTLIFFLLCYPDDSLRSLVHLMPNLRAKVHAVEAVRELEADVSRFLVLRTLINIGLALAAWGIFVAVGLPNPIMWAVLAGMLNYIPYVGPLLVFVFILGASVIAFDTLQQALIAPLLFVVINTIEGFIVTPIVLGHRMNLSPVVIFLGLIAWGALWGIPGALMSVPLLVCFRIACDHIEPLRPIGLFLADSRREEEMHQDRTQRSADHRRKDEHKHGEPESMHAGDPEAAGAAGSAAS